MLTIVLTADNTVW